MTHNFKCTRNDVNYASGVSTDNVSTQKGVPLSMGRFKWHIHSLSEQWFWLSTPARGHDTMGHHVITVPPAPMTALCNRLADWR